MKLRHVVLILAFLLAFVVLTGCEASPTPIVIIVTQPPQPTYTPPPTYTPYPTSTVASTATSTPLPAPTATPTIVPATATAPPPTATPTVPPATATALPPTATPPPPAPTNTATRTRTPLLCTVSYAAQLHVGGKARVQNDDSHNVRTQPNTSGRILGTIGNGTIVDVLDGPICGNDMWWWYVRVSGGTLTGWTAEAGGGVRWLVNYTGGLSCVSTTERVTFPAGGTTYKVNTILSAGCTRSYVLRIMAGQKLAIGHGGYPNPGLASIVVTNPGGVVLPGSGAAGSIWFNCATTGDYKITVSGVGPVQFDITVPPL